MFRFEDPQYLYLLAVVVLLALIRLITYRKQKQRLQRFGDPDLVRQLMPLVSRWRPGLKFWLLEGALALLIVSFLLLQMCWWGINYLPSAQGASVHTYSS